MQIGGVDPNTALEPCSLWCTPPDEGGEGGSNGWCCDALDFSNPVHVEKAAWAARVASSILYRLSGSRFSGSCQSDEFLCVRRNPDCGCLTFSCGAGWWGLPSLPFPTGSGSWVNERCCGEKACDCAPRRRVLLPYGPVSSIDEVTVNGVVLDPESYKLVDGRYLYLCDDVDIMACFNACDESGFRVQWTHGLAPPPEAENAACVLSCELAKACIGAQCQLPKRVSTVSRQGVSWTVIDPQEFIENGKTGLYEVDLFLAAWPREDVATSVLFPEQVEPLDFTQTTRARW